MLHTLGERLCDQHFTLHGLVVPDADAWLGPDLACGTDLAIGVHRDAMDIIGVVHEKLLSVLCTVHDNSDSSRVVCNLSSGCVPEVVAAVVTAETVNVLEL